MEAPPPDHRVAYGDGPLQFGNLRLPEGPGPFPVALFVHGGCWLSAFPIAHVGRLEQAWADAGYAVWSIEYRRVGDDGGGWPATFLDVEDGADHLRALARDYPLDLSRVVAAGHSAGGYFALWLASRRNIPRESPLWRPDPLPVSAVLALAPAPDLDDLHAQGVCGEVIDGLMGGSPAEHPDRYAAASMTRLPPPDVPETLIVGARDRSWGPAGRAYFQHARAAGDANVSLIEAPESGHFEMIVPGTSTWPLVMRELGRTVAQSAPGMLVSADWLSEHLADPDVVVLHAEAQRERYDEGHIPGARFLDMNGLAWEGDPPVGTQMRTPAEIRAALEAAGVRDGQRVVVYGANPLLAARAWMTLDVMGWGARASMLDGGFGGWKEDGRAVSTEVPTFAPGSVTLRPRTDVVVDADWVLSRLDDTAVTVIDARAADQYTGADGGMNGQLHAGHIPGAFNVDADSLMESRAVPRVRDRAGLEALFRASGAGDGGTVVTYCVVGLRASFAYFVARMLGYDAKIYDGSWREWGSKDLPYVSGPSRR